jgi:hypothetical protein
MALSGASRRKQTPSSHPLAPNGERSKLTEDQWATVRTNVFKRWFGDWHEASKAGILRGQSVATVKMGAIQAKVGQKASEAAFEWLDRNPQPDIVRDGLGPVAFDRKSIEDTLWHGFSGPKLNALTAVRQVIEQGAELDRLPKVLSETKRIGFRNRVPLCGRWFPIPACGS